MKRIGIYIRVSTEEQVRIQEGSLVSQKNRLLEYVEFQNKREANWGALVDIYCDEGKSAKNMKSRSEFLRMLGDIKTGRINLIDCHRTFKTEPKYKRLLRSLGFT